MKKKIVLFTLLTCLISVLVMGCGTSNDSSSTSKESSSTKSTETPSTEPSAELTISAAASLKEAMAELEPIFKEANPNISLVFNFGASGSLQQQIEQGAPADLFISAGQSQMKALAEKDLILDSTQKDLVKNELVLVGPKDTTITGLDDLKTDKVAKIASGEPTSVPAGKYADEVFTKLGIKDDIQSKLVFAKDVKEVLAWSTSGNADVGFVYLSDALSNDSAKIIETVSEDLHSPITYPVGVIKSTKNPDAAKKFENFLFTDKAKEIFEKYGYKAI